jgi:hypothetical protein
MVHTETQTQATVHTETQTQATVHTETQTQATQDKPRACSACGTALDVECDVAARAMLKVTKTCTDPEADAEESALLLEQIKKNNVLFQKCSCNPAKWAMNWRGPDLTKRQYGNAGGFQPLCLVRRNLRGKEELKQLLKQLFDPHRSLSTHAASYSAVLSSAGSKRTSIDVDQTLQAAQQSGVEAAARPPRRIKLKPNPVAVQMPE